MQYSDMADRPLYPSRSPVLGIVVHRNACILTSMRCTIVLMFLTGVHVRRDFATFMLQVGTRDQVWPRVRV